MPRKQPSPAEVVRREFEGLERLVRNLLVDNVNFRTGHYYERYPSSVSLVHGPLKGMAETILERLAQSRKLSMEMAADTEVPGLSRTHSGTFHGLAVTVAEGEGGKWTLSMDMDGAFHGGDDLRREFDTEAEALEAVEGFVRTRRIPEGMRPADLYMAPAPTPR